MWRQLPAGWPPAWPGEALGPHGRRRGPVKPGWGPPCAFRSRPRRQGAERRPASRLGGSDPAAWPSPSPRQRVPPSVGKSGPARWATEGQGFSGSGRSDLAPCQAREGTDGRRPPRVQPGGGLCGLRRLGAAGGTLCVASPRTRETRGPTARLPPPSPRLPADAPRGRREGTVAARASEPDRRSGAWPLWTLPGPCRF